MELKTCRKGLHQYVPERYMSGKYKGCPGCRAEQQRAYHEANRDEAAARRGVWGDLHSDHVKEQHRAYRKANRERVAERQRAYYEANREARLARVRAYYEANSEKILEQKRAYRARKKLERQQKANEQ